MTGFAMLAMMESLEFRKVSTNFNIDFSMGRIVVLCNPCRNAKAGQKDKLDWIIIYFRGPYTQSLL